MLGVVVRRFLRSYAMSATSRKRPLLIGFSLVPFSGGQEKVKRVPVNFLLGVTSNSTLERTIGGALWES
jgi:hypothetical protein